MACESHMRTTYWPLLAAAAWFCSGFSASAFAAPEFTLHELNSGQPGPTLLVVGGIQGDEPGGFTAASLLVTKYQITGGNVWVVPNLNFLSIIRNSRGVYGDMNRKFAELARADPEFSTVTRIKKLLLDLRIDLIVNLHDGSGWYAPAYQNSKRNPSQWGQSIIIDQETVAGSPFGNLIEIATQMADQANARITKQAHHFHVKNTRTWAGDVEMSKSLSYFAVRNHAPALAIEATKSFNTPMRVLHHLYAIEALMDAIGISYTRNFDLQVAAVRDVIGENLRMSLYDEKVTLDLANPRKKLSRFPMPKNKKPMFASSNPLVALSNDKNMYRVSYGNHKLITIQPQYVDFDNGLKMITMTADGITRRIPIGAIVNIQSEFSVKSDKPYRVDVVGFRGRKNGSDAGIGISKRDLLQKYSLDKDGSKYRVEFYNGKRFAGMVIVDFSGAGGKIVSQPAGDILNRGNLTGG